MSFQVEVWGEYGCFSRPELKTERYTYDVMDRYFTSASATPALIFPTLLNLASKHLRKMGGGKEVYWSKQVVALTGMITESYPLHHTLYEQGVFQLGYYHQTQKRYEKKEKTNADQTMREETDNV